VKRVLVILILLGGLLVFPVSADGAKGTEMKVAVGVFEIELEPQVDEGAPAGRMKIEKQYSGGLVGSGVGQMISKRVDGGAAVYYAIEEFVGSVDGKSGAFTLVHKGYMDADSQSLEVEILSGSGSGELAEISGTMTISQTSGGHSCELSYRF
jgi:hypothetical protein